MRLSQDHKQITNFRRIIDRFGRMCVAKMFGICFRIRSTWIKFRARKITQYMENDNEITTANGKRFRYQTNDNKIIYYFLDIKSKSFDSKLVVAI